jgi:lipoyl(octanoyl) transferase
MSKSIEVFRLLRQGKATGAENMAVDEAISQGIAAGVSPPTLRFYAWAPPCVSLGRNQAAAGVDFAACAARGYDVVRRPTGGRAILHTDELTYSLVASPHHPLMAGLVLDVYLRISHGLVAGLRNLGIVAEEAPGTNRAGPDVSAACFEVPSAYEIVTSGRKILGSAQARRAQSVLQHGSLPLAGDVARVIDCLSFDSAAERDALRRSLADHATTVEAVTGRRVIYAEAVDALVGGMAEALNIEWVEAGLTEQERGWTAELIREKYANRQWTLRV